MEYDRDVFEWEDLAWFNAISNVLPLISQCLTMPSFRKGSGYTYKDTPIHFLSCGKEGISFRWQFVQEACRTVADPSQEHTSHKHRARSSPLMFCFKVVFMAHNELQSLPLRASSLSKSHVPSGSLEDHFACAADVS